MAILPCAGNKVGATSQFSHRRHIACELSQTRQKSYDACLPRQTCEALNRNLPSPSESLGRRILDRYLNLCARRPLLVSLVVAGSLLGCVWIAQRVRVTPEIAALLPRESPDQRALEVLKRRTQVSQPLLLLVSSQDTDLNRRLATKLAEAVGSWPETTFAIARRDPAQLWERRLLFVPAEAISSLADAIEERVRWEHCQALPGCFSLSDDPPPVPDENALRELLKADPATAILMHLLGEVDSSRSVGRKLNRRGELCTPDGTLCAVEAILDGDPNNLSFADMVLARVENLFARVRPSDAPADLRLVVSGAYRNAPTARRMTTEDLQRASAVSTVLMIGLLLVWYRSWRTIAYLFLPLVSGLVWAAGFVALIDPELNVLTAFTLGILGGLGVEYGIHILTHWRTVGAYSRDPSQNRRMALEGLRETLLVLGGSMGIAVVTTASGFLALAVARFRGFSEMAILAAGGVVLTLFAFVLVLPIMARVFGFRARENPEPRTSITAHSPGNWSISRRLAISIVTGGGLIGLVLGFSGTTIGFERDFRKLQPAEIAHGLPSNQALRGSSRRAVYMLGDSHEHVEAVARVLREEGPGPLGERDEPWILTARSFVPGDQPRKLAAAERLHTVVRRALRRAEGKAAAQLTKLLELSSVTDTIHPSMLPPWIRGWLFERDGRFGTVGIIYTDLSGSDAGAMQVLHERIETWRERFPGVVFASAVAQLGEVIPGLVADAPLVLGLALAGLILSTWIVSRSWRRTLLVLVPLGLATAIGLGVMTALGIKVSLYNLIVFPLFLGISIDGAVYVVWAFDKGIPQRAELMSKFGAIMISTLTNMTGFAGMLIARNPGITSLGVTALIMLGAALVVNVAWLPSLMLLVAKPARQTGENRVSKLETVNRL